ncbi:unnamed protein product, partial [Scytosiphon promiscuus]
SKVALEGLREGREATRSLMVAIEMCQRASPNSGGATSSVGSSSSIRAGGARRRSSTGGGASGAEGRGRGAPSSAGTVEDFDVDGDDGDLDLSASLWFQTLDKILSAKGAACRSSSSSGAAFSSAGGGGRGGRSAAATAAAGELPQTAAVMGGVLDALLQRTLSSMAGYVPLPAIVKKVVSDHAGNSLGEFRHVILAMLDTYSYDTAIHRTAASLLFDSLRGVVRERHTLKGAGVRVSAVAGVDLPPPRSTRGTAGNGISGAPDATGVSPSEADSPPPPPPPPLVPAGLLKAVGSGVINVSPGGMAVVEHLGRGGGGADAYGDGE